MGATNRLGAPSPIQGSTSKPSVQFPGTFVDFANNAPPKGLGVTFTACIPRHRKTHNGRKTERERRSVRGSCSRKHRQLLDPLPPEIKGARSPREL